MQIKCILPREGHSSITRKSEHSSDLKVISMSTLFVTGYYLNITTNRKNRTVTKQNNATKKKNYYNTNQIALTSCACLILRETCDLVSQGQRNTYQLT